MNIRIEKGADRRFAFTDRKNGYFELVNGPSTARSGGYIRGSVKFLSGFFAASADSASGNADYLQINAGHTEVRPDGFSFFFDQGNPHAVLDVSLLLDEQAFYLSLRDDDSGNRSAHTGIGIALEPPHPVPQEPCKSPGALPSAAHQPVWIKYEQDGICFYQNDTGTAVASTSAFTLEVSEGGSISVFSDTGGAQWYLVFEEDGITAREKALRLARTGAVSAHRAQIDAFFAAFRSDSGDRAFDEAVAWAQFSGWLLVTDENGKGIWAGLPWFRDNWGRDTFIALTGILLVSGRFAEAREVLSGFAAHQNRDSESPDYGRIPNRFRGKDDVIFNTADGTLWFIRALWEYVQYSGDTGILGELKETIDLALDADSSRRTDRHGFLLHGDADTWMDARIRGDHPWSARGDRACDIQALWYTALKIGSRIASLHGEAAKGAERNELAEKVKHSFRAYFWSGERNALADHLPPGPHGEWLRDFRVRPNQLFALSVPSILDGNDGSLLDAGHRAHILENVSRELVSPFGLFSLSPDDPLFHPRHENPDLYHKDAAYHNGTIWVWNTGSYVSAGAEKSTSVLPSLSEELLRNEAALIAGQGCAGSLSENIHAEPGADGKPVLSGTWSQAWSVSEFARNVYQDIIGFNPRLADGHLELRPHLPSFASRWSAEARFGRDWILSVELERTAGEKGARGVNCRLLWKTAGGKAAPVPALTVNGRAIVPGTPVELFFPDGKKSAGIGRTSFPVHSFNNEWCGPVHQKNYLEKLVLAGRVNGKNGSDLNASALEWFFDSDVFKKKYLYRLSLGALWSPDETVFRLWAPTARSVQLVLYPDGTDSAPSAVMEMSEGSLQKGTAGVWSLPVAGNRDGTYYRFRVRSHGIIRDSADPYARACGVNGVRSMVVDFASTDPEGWDTIRAPSLASPNDAVVYEVHVADISSSPSWNGTRNPRRTYLAAAEGGTSLDGVPTGFDHIKRLGVTHVQLLPVFDYGSVDERRTRDDAYGEQLVSGKFNWGYDPENYGAPEGSYATDPFDGRVRIRELKTLIGECISNGMGVIMDVVYNHVPAAQNNALGICVNGYYFRVDSFSGAGDDTASEREMFRSYMIDSLSWWLAEYKLSGFRFDLMGLHDVETMNAIVDALRNIKSDVLVYGEGWDMYRGGRMVSASMVEARKMKNIGFFNDAFRCAIKGSVFKEHEGGFIHDGSHRESVKFGLVGAVYHPQVHNRLVDGTANPNPWTAFTGTSVNYTEIHDNSTLYDKLVLVESGRSETYYERLHKTAVSLVLLAQGQPVIHAGMEFMRTKEIPADLLASHPHLHDLYRTKERKRAFSHNTYNLSDRINGLDWPRCAEKREVVGYVRRLIALRKAHPMFRLRTAEEVALSISFPGNGTQAAGIVPGQAVPPSQPELLAWKIDGFNSVDIWEGVCVVVNPFEDAMAFSLPESCNGGNWNLITDGDYFRDEEGDATAGESGPLPLAPLTTVYIEGKALYLYAEF